VYFPEPGRYCGTPEVFALPFGAVVVAPGTLLFAAVQHAARRALRDRPSWRNISSAVLVYLLLLVAANWLSLIKLLWF
jgi:hypothetical protein